MAEKRKYTKKAAEPVPAKPEPKTIAKIAIGKVYHICPECNTMFEGDSCPKCGWGK